MKQDERRAETGGFVEFERVRQDEKGYKRLFIGGRFDLFVWYEEDRQTITGFQVVWDYERAITYHVGGSYHHNVITGGDLHGGRMSPVLDGDAGTIDIQIIQEFKEKAASLEPEIRDFVLRALGRIAEDQAMRRLTGRCPYCRTRLTAPRPGRFRCPRCGKIFLTDQGKFGAR